MSRLQRLVNTGRIGTRAMLERTVPFWPIEWIEHLQRIRLRSIIRHAYVTVPFYHKAMDERGLRPEDFQTISDLCKLPLIDSAMLQNDPKQFGSTLFQGKAPEAFHTCGTRSGIPKSVYWDNTSVLHKMAFAERDRAVLCRLIGRNWGHRQLYILESASAPLKNRALWDSAMTLPRGIAHRYFLPPDLPVRQIADQIDAIQPDVVFSLGSYADRFFRLLDDQHLVLAAPRVWVYGGDMLSHRGRELIENKFGGIVYSTYQSVEAGKIGFQCERREGFHLNVDLCAVRLVDGEGKPVGPSSPGEVVVSNLYNRAMVLLNYRLGDRGVAADRPCTCGRTLPMLERLDGRCSETIILPDGRRMHASDPGLGFTEELTTVIQSQIVQPAPDKIIWRLVPRSDTDRALLELKLLEKAKSVWGEDLQVKIDFTSAIAPGPGGKHLRVVSQVER